MPRHSAIGTSRQLPERFVVLDGLRGVAAVCVVACHIPPLLGWATASAGLAVDFFFCLSGFVIEHAYGARFAEGLRAREFAVARALRLYPLYLLGTVLGIAGVLYGGVFPGDVPPAGTLPAIATLAAFGLPSAYLPALYALDSPAWSLACEAAANALYALIPRALRDPRTIAAIALPSLAAVVALTLYQGTADFGWRSDWTATGGLARVGFSFFVGVALRRTAARRRLPRTSPWLLALVLAALLNVPDLGAARIWYELAFIALLSPAIVAIGAAAEADGATARLFAFAGAVSYPVYVLHKPLYALVFVGLIRHAGIDLSAAAPWSGIGFVAGMVALAWGAGRWIDRPLRRALAWLVSTRRQQDSRHQSRVRIA